jgi:hypothetical protein
MTPTLGSRLSKSDLAVEQARHMEMKREHHSIKFVRSCVVADERASAFVKSWRVARVTERERGQHLASRCRSGFRDMVSGREPELQTLFPSLLVGLAGYTAKVQSYCVRSRVPAITRSSCFEGCCTAATVLQ